MINEAKEREAFHAHCHSINLSTMRTKHWYDSTTVQNLWNGWIERACKAAADYDALTQALADAKAENARIIRELNFLTTEGEENDGWCEHNRQYYESAIDGNGDSFDNCVMCERDALRADLESARAELAEAKADLEKLFAYDGTYCAAVLSGEVDDED